MGFAIGAAAGFLIGYIMFQSLPFELPLACIGGWFGSKWYVRVQLKKRKKEFLSQFCDYLDAVSASLSCGRNTIEAFSGAEKDMNGLFRTDAPICYESAKLTDGLNTGHRVQPLLSAMAEDSGCSEVRTFGDVYGICSSAGGNLKSIVDDTRSMLVEKNGVEQEIQTVLTGPKNELNIMAIMPLVLLASLRVFGGGFLDGNESSMAINAAALCIFVFSYLLGRKIVDIRV